MSLEASRWLSRYTWLIHHPAPCGPGFPSRRPCRARAAVASRALFGWPCDVIVTDHLAEPVGNRTAAHDHLAGLGRLVCGVPRRREAGVADRVPSARGRWLGSC